MKTITIPNISYPTVTVRINDAKYVYNSGETVEVPEEVAALFEDIESNKPPMREDDLDEADGIVDGTASRYVGDAEKVRKYCFFYHGGLTSVKLTKATVIEQSGFSNCSSLKTVDAPYVTTIESDAFTGCRDLVSIDFPKVTTIDKNAFGNCPSLKTVVLRSVESINTTAFDNCAHLNTTKDGYIYVPKANLSAIKTSAASTGWVTQLRGIEDYTKDGTINGALDKYKI